MFDRLGRRLDRALGRFRQRGILTEPMIRKGLREVRRALLEADVNFKVTRDFLKRVEKRAVGEGVIRSISPGQQVVKIVHDELAGLLGEDVAELTWARKPPTVILMAGLQGSGKTTTAVKLARLVAREGRRPLLAGCDVYRPAAAEQLATLCERAGLPVHAGGRADDPVAVARAALDDARGRGCDVVVVDTAGRLQIDEAMMAEIGRLQKKLTPTEVLLVADAMTGQEAVNIARGFDRALGLTGVVLTKLDGDARGGAALSIRGVTGRPIKFVGVGEGLDDLERVDPGRLAGRILQMGDVVGLVERAQRSIDAEAQAKIEENVLRKGRFTLEDFLTALRQVQAMGPLEQIVKMIPGMKRKLPLGNVDPKKIRHVEAIILSMTPAERSEPRLLNRSRRIRIARGSGRPVSEVNRLLKQFREMQKLMKQMRGMAPPLNQLR